MGVDSNYRQIHYACLPLQVQLGTPWMDLKANSLDWAHLGTKQRRYLLSLILSASLHSNYVWHGRRFDKLEMTSASDKNASSFSKWSACNERLTDGQQHALLQCPIYHRALRTRGAGSKGFSVMCRPFLSGFHCLEISPSENTTHVTSETNSWIKQDDTWLSFVFRSSIL